MNLDLDVSCSHESKSREFYQCGFHAGIPITAAREIVLLPGRSKPM
jgi:hypothetical protein